MAGKGYGRVITAMVTPFDRDGRLDLERARQLARRLVDAGSDGLVVAGSTGESATLHDEEKVALFRAVVEEVGDRAFVWAGTGTNSTEHSVRLTRQAEAAGAHGVMLVAPYYNKPTQQGLALHFRAVAESTRLPVMLYNVPGRTAVNLLPETVAELARLPNVVALKEASGNLDQVSEAVRLLPPGFAVYSGDDSLTLPILAVGGVGVVSVASHLVAGQLRAMVEAFAAGRVAEAREIHLRLMPLFRVLFVRPNPIPVKAALARAGFPVGGLRPPLHEADPDCVRQIDQVLAELGVAAAA